MAIAHGIAKSRTRLSEHTHPEGCPIPERKRYNFWLYMWLLLNHGWSAGLKKERTGKDNNGKRSFFPEAARGIL